MTVKHLGAVTLTGEEILKQAVKVLGTRKAEDVCALDIRGISIIADYFLIASGNSNTQVRSLAEEIESKLSEAGIEPLRVEGTQSSTWIIIDYGSIIIHIFMRDTREFYNIEHLWADAKPVDISAFADNGEEEKTEEK